METLERTHSVSSTREYDRCPRRYRFAYVDREPARRHVPATWRVGSAVHAALEAAYRRRHVRGGSGAMDDCVEAAVAALHVAWDELELTGQASLGEAVLTVRRFLVGERIRGDEVLGVERLLATTTSDGLRIAGYADLVIRRGDVLEIRDHKVTRYERDERRLREDFQLNLYGWLAVRTWRWARSIRAGHCYPLSGRIAVVTLERASMEAAAGRVRATARRIDRDGVFAPEPGEHCTSCAWAELCPAWPPGTITGEGGPAG